MPISNLVNLAEIVSGVDIDRDGDIGQRTSNESGAVTSHTLSSSVSSTRTLPVFDPVTPKVSILAIGKNTLESANELLVAAEKAAAEFQPQATLKADFMLIQYVGPGIPNPPFKCTVANATGVRLEFVEEGSAGVLEFYKPPPILEPGAVASFLIDKKATFKLQYYIQVFQGPSLGWVRVEDGGLPRFATLSQSNRSPKIEADVQVADGNPRGPPAMYPTNITFDLNLVQTPTSITEGVDVLQIFAKQLITQTPRPRG